MVSKGLHWSGQQVSKGQRRVVRSMVDDRSKYRAQCVAAMEINITGKQLPRKRESYIVVITYRLIVETLAQSGRRTRDAGSQWITGNPGGAYCRLLSSSVVWALWQLLAQEQQCTDRVRVIAGWLSPFLSKANLALAFSVALHCSPKILVGTREYCFDHSAKKHRTRGTERLL